MKTMIDLMCAACVSRIIAINFAGYFFRQQLLPNSHIFLAIFLLCFRNHYTINPLFNVHSLFPPNFITFPSFTIQRTKSQNI